MAVIINASTSTGLVQSADTSGIIQFQSNGSTKATLNSSGFSYPGGVLQVVSATKTDAFSSTSTSFTDITGLSVNITPTASSSKILVMYSASIAATSGEYTSLFQIVRGSTAICIGDTSGSRTRATNMNRTSTSNGNQLWVVSQNFLDSPATTSSTTYKIQGLVQTPGTFFVNRTSANDNGDYIGATTSTITVMEIAG